VAGKEKIDQLGMITNYEWFVTAAGLFLQIPWFALLGCVTSHSANVPGTMGEEQGVKSIEYSRATMELELAVSLLNGGG
jgi:hypothetical protein